MAAELEEVVIAEIQRVNDEYSLCKPLDADVLAGALARIPGELAFEILADLCLDPESVDDPNQWVIEAALDAAERIPPGDDGDEPEGAEEPPVKIRRAGDLGKGGLARGAPAPQGKGKRLPLLQRPGPARPVLPAVAPVTAAFGYDAGRNWRPGLPTAVPGKGVPWAAPGKGAPWAAPGKGAPWAAPGKGAPWAAPGKGVAWPPRGTAAVPGWGAAGFVGLRAPAGGGPGMPVAGLGKGKPGKVAANYKTTLCANHQSGRCFAGSACTWAHSEEEMEQNLGRKLRSLETSLARYKTSICKRWASGLCGLGDDCTFAHGQDELEEWLPEGQEFPGGAAEPLAAAPSTPPTEAPRTPELSEQLPVTPPSHGPMPGTPPWLGAAAAPGTPPWLGSQVAAPGTPPWLGAAPGTPPSMRL